ncbi:uncharacterized protein E0L32_011219 [Thyridium curvatum]|uniref:tRNA(His) guanylyltransferase n=1 Tax=Thyridium curvatum TaxID=1093900 RepID=A0A507BQB7_9PEZI|nr:uncharacterized protein E0L32_011219 [Thyridium curvatum]TPX19058.1 hypothetical protein E0L32_011219 [Thyridium curvatum]
MANSKYEYVKQFEQPDALLPNTWVVVRLDGRGFTKMCAKYHFEKPNDKRALDLMNAAAKAVVTELPDITIAYGISDEYRGNMSTTEATEALNGTFSSDKNEILFSKFGINYNNEPEIYKKGSVLFREYELVEIEGRNIAEEADNIAEPVQQSKTQTEKDKKKRSKARVVVEHLDIIKDDFWDKRPWLLSGKPGSLPKQPEL